MIEDITDFINNFMENLGETKVETELRQNFRASQMPYCGLANELASHKNSKFIFGYDMAHYVGVGTAIHTILQSWSSMNPKTSKYMWGNWKCTSCGQLQNNCYVPSVCKCKSLKSSDTSNFIGFDKFWNYEEIKIEHKYLSGHIDLILKRPKKYFIVIDFKSTSMATKKLRGKTHEPSSKTYIAQIRTYASILNLYYGMDIVGWAIVNVDRDKPLQKGSYAPIVSGWNRNKSLKWEKWINISQLNYEKYVDYKVAIENNSKKEANSSLNQLILSRPCNNLKDYEQYMEYGFYTKCPNLEYCCKSSKSVKNMFLSSLGST
jgi:PD-(D/E)XK nuclease superfamily